MIPIPGGALTIYRVPRVCQHQGCDFDEKCKRKGMFFRKNCKRKGVFLGRECITRRQFSKILGATCHFSAIIPRKGYISAKFVRKTACFPPKKCKRKGVFFANFARERVWVRRPRWHTRVQKSGENPPRDPHSSPFPIHRPCPVYYGCTRLQINKNPNIYPRKPSCNRLQNAKTLVLQNLDLPLFNLSAADSM